MEKNVLRALLGLAVSSEDNVAARAQALAELAHACHAGGQEADCDTVLAEAIEYLNAAPAEPAITGTQADNLGNLAWRLDRLPLARRALELAADRLEQAGMHTTLAVTWHNLAETLRAAGEGAAALDAYRKAVAKRAAEDVTSRLITLRALADAEAEWGTAEACDEAIRTAVEELTASELGAARVAGEAHKIGRLAERLGRFQLARSAYEIAARGFAESENAALLGVTLADIADTWAAERDGARALEAYRRAASVNAGHDDIETKVRKLCLLAEAEATWGDADQAAAAIDEALPLLRPVAPGEGMARAAHSLGDSAARVGRRMQARSAYELALRGFEAAGQFDEQASMLRHIGDTWHGEDEQARAAAYRSAAEAARVAGDVEDLLRTLRALAEAEADAGHPERCDDALREAVTRLASAGLPDSGHAVEAHRIGDVAERLGRPVPVEARVLEPAGGHLCWCGSGLPFGKCHGGAA